MFASQCSIPYRQSYQYNLIIIESLYASNCNNHNSSNRNNSTWHLDPTTEDIASLYAGHAPLSIRLIQTMARDLRQADLVCCTWINTFEFNLMVFYRRCWVWCLASSSLLTKHMSKHVRRCSIWGFMSFIDYFVCFQHWTPSLNSARRLCLSLGDAPMPKFPPFAWLANKKVRVANNCRVIIIHLYCLYFRSKFCCCNYHYDERHIILGVAIRGASCRVRTQGRRAHCRACTSQTTSQKIIPSIFPFVPCVHENQQCYE
jgi:hypothetical protein